MVTTVARLSLGYKWVTTVARLQIGFNSLLSSGYSPQVVEEYKLSWYTYIILYCFGTQVLIMHLSMYCHTLPLPGEVGAKYGPHNYRGYSHFRICEVYNIHSRADHEVSAFLLL